MKSPLIENIYQIEKGDYVGTFYMGAGTISREETVWCRCPYCKHIFPYKKSVLVPILTMVIAMVLFLVILFIAIFQIEQQYRGEHAVGEFACPRCQSLDTHGFYTFWEEDGMLCNGSREYNLDNAHHSYIDCDNCGYTWKIYREEWERAGY